MRILFVQDLACGLFHQNSGGHGDVYIIHGDNCFNCGLHVISLADSMAKGDGRA